MALAATDTLRLPETPEEIRDQILTDLRLEMRNVGITDPEASVAPETDNYIWATAQANAGALQYAAIGQLRPTLTPLFATGQDLERWRLALKLPVVAATGATGKITVKVNGGGSITVPLGQQFILPNGLRGEVSYTHLAVVDGQDVNVRMVDTGSRSNAESGTETRWINPPFNLDTKGRVSINKPLTGGYDTETDARKRQRVLNRLGNSPGGGNFGQLIEIALNALASVQLCVVYPALGGPSSCKVVILKAFDRDRNDFSREFDSTAATYVRQQIQKTVSEGNDIVVTTGADEETDLALSLSIPSSALAGGAGTGWVDAVPWPARAAAAVPCTVLAVTTSREFTITGVDTTEPIDGVTRISWWSPADRQFRTNIIIDHTAAGADWAVTVQDPFVDSTNAIIATGDYISPAAERQDAYGTEMLDLFEALAPGENTADANRLPRSQRNPTISDGGPTSDITSSFEGEFTRAHDEVSDVDIAYISLSTPTIPASVDDPPNVLVPRHFGIYQQA